MNTRMDRTKLGIGTYILQPYARTERHIRELAECGVDFVVCMNNDRETLDLFEKYGVGAIVSGVIPGWWGGDGDRAGQLSTVNPMSEYEAAAEKFTDHPAIWGIDTGDEPSALDFPYYGEVINFTRKAFPKQFPYLNLYPNYASVAQNNAQQTVNQLGTATYAEHIAEYGKYVGTDYICYDYYMYAASVAGAYENLRIVADECRRSGRSLWIVLQVNSSRPETWISANQLRFQAYSAMAFGAENIIWACWTAGWWNNQVLDDKGEKTEQYDKLKTVNEELHFLGERYMKYSCASTHFVGFASDDKYLCNLNQKPIDKLNTGIFLDFGTDHPVIVGQMKARCGSDKYALMVCSASDPMDESPSMTILKYRAPGRKITVSDGYSTLRCAPDSDGVYTAVIPSNGALLIEAE